MSVVISLIVISTDLKSIIPMFFTLSSTHQPTQVSRLVYVTSKSGDGVGVNVGVGVGGGVETGRTENLPVIVAYSPHIQQESVSDSGLRINQYSPLGSRART